MLVFYNNVGISGYFVNSMEVADSSNHNITNSQVLCALHVQLLAVLV